MKYTPYEKYLNFLKKHNIYNEKLINYIRENTIFIDYSNEEYRSYISTVPVVEKDKRLKTIKSILPYINNDITISININEYVKALIYYQKLRKYFNIGEEIEILPLFYEKLFIKENETEELKQYREELDKTIIRENTRKYVVALNSQNDLQRYYEEGNINVTTLETKAKKLAKEYKRNYKLVNRKES